MLLRAAAAAILICASAIAAVAQAPAPPARDLDQIEEVPDRTRFAAVLGVTSYVATNCPAIEVDQAVLAAELTRLGGEALNNDPYFGRAAKQNMLKGNELLRKLGPDDYCADMRERFGPQGTEFKGLLRAKPKS